MMIASHRTNPFPGLRPFELDEEHLFFGREGQSDELMTRLQRTRFLGVVGTSGSGKSSLVRAGLLPSLYSGFLPGASSSWRIAVLRPGSAPMHNLAAALNAPDVLGVDAAPDEAIIRVALTESTLRRGSLGLVEVTQQARLAPADNLLVVVDQFEELFRYKAQAAATGQRLAAEEEAAAFVKLLLAAVNQRAVPIFVVLTMRSDFLGDCAQFRDLPETLNDSQYLIPRLTREQLRRAIEGPVAVGGATITPRLVNRLLNDTGDNPDQLPILQHALMRTWDYWEDQHTPDAPLDLEHYEAIGGMAQALSRHADQIYAGLPNDRARHLAAALFRCLTDRGADNREIRRPTPLAEICAVANAPAADLVPIVDEFRAPRRSFLMPPLAVPLVDRTVIDISHESLMRNWQRLKDWVEAEARSATIYRRLAETAALHDQGQAGYLRDPELTIALTWQAEQQPNGVWAERYAPNFDQAMAFLAASAEAAEAETVAKERARKREVNRLRGFLGIFAGLAILAGGTAVYAFQQGKVAEQERQEAEQQRQEAERQTGIAEEQRQEAERQTGVAERRQEEASWQRRLAEEREQEAETARDAEAEQRQQAQVARQRAEAGEAEAQRQAQIAQENEATAEAATAEAEREKRRAERQALNANIQAGALTVENLMASKLALPALISGLEVGQAIRQIEADASGEQLVATQQAKLTTPQGDAQRSPIDSSTRLQAVSALRESYHNHSLERNILGHTSWVNSVSFAPDGETIASASDDGSVKLWDRRGRELQTLEGHTDWVNSVSFSPDGETIASASDDGTVRLWDRSGRELQTLGHGGNVNSVSFAPDGETLASASSNGTVKLWDRRGRELQTLEGHTAGVNSVSFAPDGETIASASDDGSVKLWDRRGRELQTLEGHTAGVSSVSFSPDGQTLASASFDFSVKLWDRSGRQLQTLEGHTAGVSSVSFSPDGQTLASASDDGSVKLWDRRGRELQTLEGHTAGVNSVSFSPDGQTLASASFDFSVKLWDRRGRQLQTLEGHTSWVSSVSFSPDGETLASASYDGSVKLWDRSGRQLQTLEGHTAGVSSVSFSPDGQTIASSSLDSTVKLWDVRTGRELQTLEVSIAGLDVSFAPDGQTLAIADGSLTLWDVRTGRKLKTLGLDSLGRSLDFVSRLSISSDGQTLASNSIHGVKLWNVRTGQELKTLSDHTDDVTSMTFSPDGETIVIASRDGTGTVQLWDVSTGRELQTLEGHTDHVTSVTFSPDGETLASASNDGTVKLWDRSGRELQTLEGHTDLVLSVTFSPDGETLASAGSRGTIILWNFDLDDLIAKSCDWLSDYMNYSASPEEQALCADELRLSQTTAPKERINWVAAVRSFGSRMLGAR
jgi:WD40 repeat protein